MSNVIRLSHPVSRVRIQSPVRHQFESVRPGVPASLSRVRDDGDGRDPGNGEQRVPAAGLCDPSALAAEHARGVEAGRQAVAEEMQKEFEKRLESERERAQALLTGMREQIERLSERLEREAFRFALAVAGKIVAREVTLDNQIVVRQIQEALRRVLGVDMVTIRVNPQDEAVLRDNKPALLSGSDSIREVVIEPDDKIDRGGCVIETSAGNVDARRVTQLKQIESALFG